MVTKIFKLLLLISPIATGIRVAPEMFDMILFRLGIISLFMASLIDKSRREIPQTIKSIILGLMGLMFMNIFINTFDPRVMMQTQNLFWAILGVYIVYAYWDEKQVAKNYILFAGLINLAFFISQRLGFDPVFEIKTYLGEEGAFLGNKQRLMTYFALITPFLNIWLLIVALILGLYTKQYVIFIPIAIMLYLKTKTKKEKAGVAIVILFSLIAAREHIQQALLFRFNVAWKPALSLFFDKPLLGYGIGIRAIENLEVLGNSYFQFIFGVGILGMVWFGYIFKKLWKQILRNPAILSLALVMLIEYPLEIPRLWFTIIAIIAFFIIKEKERELS